MPMAEVLYRPVAAQWQGKSEAGAVRAAVLHAHGAAVRLDDAAHDGEAQPGAADGGGARAAAIEALEDARAFLRRDARPVVRDAHPPPGPLRLGRDHDLVALDRA